MKEYRVIVEHIDEIRYYTHILAKNKNEAKEFIESKPYVERVIKIEEIQTDEYEELDYIGGIYE